MKYALIFLFFALTLFSLVIIGLSYANMTNLKECLDTQEQLSEEQEEIIQTRLEIYNQACQTNRRHISQIQSCYQTAERDLIIPINWLIKVGRNVGFRLPDTERIINKHNSLCPDYQMSKDYYIERSIF